MNKYSKMCIILAVVMVLGAFMSRLLFQVNILGQAVKPSSFLIASNMLLIIGLYFKK